MSNEQQLQETLALLESEPRNPEALGRLVEQVSSGTEPMVVLQAGRNVFAGLQDWPGLIGFYQALMPALEDAVLQSLIAFDMGQIYEQQLGQPGEAIGAYQQSFQLNRADVRPLHAARALYVQHQQWDAVAQLLQLELHVIPDGQTRAERLTELGWVQLQQLGQRDAAVESFQAALQQIPGFPGAQQGMAEATGEGGSAPPLPNERDQPVTDPHDAITANQAALREAVETLDPEAIEAIEPSDESVFERDTRDIDAAALMADDDDVVTLHTAEVTALGLEEVTDEDPIADDEPTVVDPGSHALLDEEPETTLVDDEEEGEGQEEAEVDVTDEAELIEAEPVEEVAEVEAEVEAEAVEEVAELEAEAVEEVVEVEAEAVEEVAELEAEAVEEVAELEAEAVEEVAEVEAEAVEEVAEVIEEAVEEAEEPEPAPAAPDQPTFEDWVARAERSSGEDAAVAYLRAAGALESPRDPELVRDAFEKALSIEEQPSRWVAELRAIMLEDPAAWQAVQRALIERFDQGEGDYRRAAYEVGFYCLGDYEAALEVAGEDVGDPPEIVQLAKVGNWRKAHLELVAELKKAGLADAEPTALRLEADLAMGLGKVEKAIDSLRKLSRKGTLEGTTRELLKALYRSQEKWNPLIDVLKREVDASDDEDQQVAIYREMVSIYRDQLSLDVMVIQTYNNLLKIRPHDRESLVALSSKLEEMRRFPDLVDVLRRRAEIAESASERTRLLLEVANLYVDKFSNQAEAVRAFEAVRDVEPDNQQAIDFLSQMYKQRGDWPKLVDIRRTYVDQVEDPREQAVILAEIAAVAFDRLRDPELSEELWLEVLARDPEHAEGLASLTKVYERQRDWEKLAGVLDKRLELVSDQDPERAELLEKLGSIHADRLDNRELAVEAYEALLALAPDNRRAADALKKSYIELQWWDRLEAFYAGQDAWTDYVRILETLAGTQKDPNVTVELLFRASRVWLEQLDNKGRAVRALERIMTVDPGNREAAEQLAGFYEEARNHRKLRDVLGVLLDNQTEAAGRFDLLVRLARLNQQLRDASTAFGFYAQAVETLPSRLEILDEVEQVAGEVNGWSSLEETYRSGLGTALGSDEAEMLEAAEPLTLRLGRLLDEELNDIEGALECFSGVLDANPTSQPAIEALISIYQRQGDNEALLEMLDRKLALAESADERVAILAQIAGIHEAGRGDVGGAVTVQLQILDEVDKSHRAHLEALLALHRLYTQQEDWASLVGIIGREIEAANLEDAETHLSLHRERGQVSLHRLGDVTGALADYQTVLDFAPGDEVARGDLEALLEDPGNAIAACDILEPIYTSEESWDALVRVLEIRLAHQPVDPDDAAGVAARKGLLTRIVDLHAESRSDLAAAFEAATRLLALDASDEAVRQRLEGFAEAAMPPCWPELAEVYADRLADLRHGELDDAGRELAARYAFRLAQIADERLGDTDRSIEGYETTLELKPEHRAALDALADLFTRTGRWESLLEVHRRQIALSDDPVEVRTIRFQIAALFESMLDDPAQGIGTYLEVLTDQPDDRDALQALHRLYASEGRFAELADNLSREIDLTESGTDEWCDLMCRLARVKEERLDRVADAVETYREVLSARPDNPEAVQALERLLSNELVAGEASRILAPLYESSVETAKLVGALEIELTYTDDPSERLRLYHRIAGLYEEGLGNVGEAFRTLLAAVGEAPLDVETQDKLYRLAELRPSWHELVQRFDELADETGDPRQAAELYVRLAKLAEDRLDDPTRAAGYWRKVLQAGVSEGGADAQAVLALERLYHSLSEWEQLVEVLLLKVDLPDLAEDLSARKEVYFTIRALYEDILGRKDEAINILEQVVMLDERDERALSDLDRLYADTERWHDLIENCNRRLLLCETDEERRPIWYQMGRIFETRLDDPERAIESYRQVLDVFETERPALEELEKLYRQTENWVMLLDNLERQRALAGTAAQALDLRFQAAKLLRDKLHDIAQAIDVYAEILGRDPGYEPAMASLQALLREGHEVDRLADVLGPLYRSAGQWRQLIEMHELLVAEAVEPERRAGHYRQIADIYEQELFDLSGAFQALSQALREQPREADVADRLERLARELGRWPELVELLAHLRDESSDPDARIRLGKRCARVLEEETGEVTQAISAYNAVTEIDPADGDSLQALHRLYQTAGRWPELADVIEREIGLTESEAESVELRKQLGTLLGTVLEEPERAVETFNAILTIDPGNADAIQSLEEMFRAGVQPLAIAPILQPIYADRESWPNLVDLKLAMLDHQETATERFATLCDAGEIAIDKMGDRGAALTIYGQALCERPSDESIAERLEQLADETGDHGDLAAIYRAALETEPDAFDAQRLSLKLARTLYDKLGNVESALDWFRYTLQLDAANVEALKALDEIYSKLERWHELAETLRQEREQAMEQAEIVDIGFRLARTYEDKLGNLDASAQAYYEVLDADPSHREAMQALERIHLNRQEWESLYAVYDRQAQQASDDAERASIFERMAELADTQLDRPYDAIDLWIQVRDIRPQDDNALAALEHLYAKTERLPELVEVLERRAELSDESAHQLAIYEKIGRTWRQLDSGPQAIDAYKKVLELDPSNQEGLFSLRSLYAESSDFEALSSTLETIIGYGYLEGHELLDGYVRLGELYSDVLGRADDAIRAWSAVLEQKPDDEVALEQLERLYLDGQHWESAVGVLEQKLRQSWDAADQADLLVRIAELWQVQVQDLDRAAEAWQRLLQLEPSNEQAALSLEEIYQRQENWDRLVEIYLGRIDHLDDVLDKLTALRAAAHVYEEKKEQPEGAFLVMARAFKEDPLDPDTANRLETLAHTTEMWQELVELYSDTIGEVVVERGVEETLDLHLRLAGYYLEKVQRPELAEIHYHKVLDLDEGHGGVLGALERIYEQAGQWQQLVTVLRRRLDQPIDVTEQVDLYIKIGRIQETRLNELEEAVHAYRRVRPLDENNVEALQALERIHEARAEWRQLIEVLEQRAAITYEPDEVVEMKYRIGQLWQHNIDVPERAIDTYRDILTIDQAHLPALDALQALYQSLEKWDRYLDVLEMRLMLEPPDDDRIAILSEMASIYTLEFSEVDRAIDCYRQVLDIQPGHVEAIRALNALYAQSEYWDDLASMLSSQVDHVPDPDVQAELLSIEGQVARDYIGDMFRAIQRFQRVLEINQNDQGALHALAGLYEQVGQWEDCIEVYNHLILAADDVPTRTQLLCRVGQIYEQNILDDDLALERFQTALDLDPGCVEAMESLRKLYEKRQDWQSAITVLKKQIDYSRELSDKSELNAEIGRIYEERLDDKVAAIEYFERSIDLDPTNVVAAAPLAEVCLAEQKWARAIPLLNVLVSSEVYQTQPEGLHLLHYNIAVASEELEQEDAALRHYREAHELDPSHLPTLEGLARIYLSRNELERAFRILDDLLTHHGHTMEPEKLAELYSRQGEIKLKIGERGAAQDLFHQALITNPDDPAALRQMIDLLQRQENWSQTVDYQLRLADLTGDMVEKFKLLVDAGDIYKGKLNEVEPAITAYRRAVEVDPNSKVVLQRLLDIFTRAENWKRATEVLGKLAELEEDAVRKGKIFLTIAYILRDHIGDAEQAIRFFNLTLDTHYQYLEAFQAVDTLLTQARDWKELERNYRKMIKRVTEKAAGGDEQAEQLKLMLWQNLGEIYRTRLKSWDEAVAAYKIAAHLAPDDPKIHEILAELYDKGDGNISEAIQEHHRLIQVSPFRFESYRALFTRYLEAKEFDAAWCLAGALTLLEKASEQERKYYDKYLGTKLPVAKRQLTNEQWTKLYHPELDLELGNIMAMFANYLRHAISYDLKQNWKVHKKKDLLDLSQQIMFSKLFNYAARVLGVTATNVYVKRDQVGGIRNANSDPPAMVIGADMVQGLDERELAFRIGKALSLQRPEAYLGSAYPLTANLKLFFYAAMAVSVPNAPAPVATQDYADLVREIQKMPHVQVAIQKVTKQYLDRGENPNFSTWLKALDYTSDRVGLLLCGDLRQAVNAARSEAEPSRVSKAHTKDRIRELVLFGVSRPYLKLRKDLGLAIGV